MPDDIVETPVTGLPGRTPREAIELPKTSRELEPVAIIDVSGSNEEPAGPESPMTKRELIEQALPLIVGAIEDDDAQAKSEQASGDDDKGGLRMFAANEPGEIVFEKGEDESDDERDLGDGNSANIQAKLAQFPWGGRTYLMPAVRAAEHAFQAEFGDTNSPHYMPARSRPAIELLVITDGKLSDAKEFESWLAANADETCVICVAVIGYGTGHDQAVEHYKALSHSPTNPNGNPYLTYVALTGVSDPMEVAYDLRLLSGTAAK